MRVGDMLRLGEGVLLVVLGVENEPVEEEEEEERRGELMMLSACAG
jgi:hypothetical protein